MTNSPPPPKKIINSMSRQPNIATTWLLPTAETLGIGSSPLKLKTRTRMAAFLIFFSYL